MNDQRILNFYRWLFENNYDGSICYYDNHFECYVNFKDGKILCSGEGSTPIECLDDLVNGLRNVGYL